ncbi:hypothetical protein [Peribacillus frigoritolerans]|uniref:hypothetical protein n=1 Tax=Peribacillus frigoritolerans TaxID=450367 RepID=UPI0020D28AF7|nr:hypothetical protein [Peribacillus frigoritolerans]MCY9002866.1 hypothetical protein [Peribacillus frigoritolerans]
MELIKLNPTKRTHLPKYQAKVEEIENQEDKIKFLEREELARFLHFANSDVLEMDYLVFITLAYTGLRV